MAGLVAYASSDEEGEDEQPQSQEAPPQVATQAAALEADEAQKEGGQIADKPAEDAPSSPRQDVENPPQPATIGPILPDAVPLGPSLPPVDAPVTTLPDPDEPTDAPSSPYSSNRGLIHHLTLPSVPNLDIPPSPPGSPPLEANKKVEQFLQLKKKGVHFNSKLEQSAALKNPSLMDKLLDFVGIDDAGQYETTLPKELWDPREFPDWAFRDKLSKTREKIAKEKESERASGGRTTVDFVPSTSSSGGGPAAWSGGISSRGEKRKGGWK
ncbi:HCNGP-domain-containing protein [Trichoderma citrinoviride]|uniref:HCNGP-domain-containing protein n=1 Tax=Trichoderma citrinoviride TaxID=58853 RepID=A0A2T4BCM3_9HYPO|nr:HCNGP-domain-containing protein [Trichoderma citrinoviride]PTB67090.1 HCNGP-domain-containing protein [Trichoderma citrinoviride]